MNVSDILDIIGDFSVSGSNVTEEQRNLFLRYLNLYKDSLYRKIAAFDNNLITVQRSNDIYDSNVGLELASASLMFVSSVINLNNSFSLKKISKIDAYKLYYKVDSFIESEPETFTTYWNRENNLFYILVYPSPTNINVAISFIDNPDDFNEDTLSANIPFPPLYHQVLVDGTLWYVFQEIGGFRDSLKAREAKDRCLKGENELSCFLQSTYEESSEKMSDF